MNTIEPGPCVHCGKDKKPSFTEYYCDICDVAAISTITNFDWNSWYINFLKQAIHVVGAEERMISAPYYLKHTDCGGPFIFLRAKPMNGEKIMRSHCVEVLNKLIEGIRPTCEICGVHYDKKFSNEDVFPNPYYQSF